MSRDKWMGSPVVLGNGFAWFSGDLVGRGPAWGLCQKSSTHGPQLVQSAHATYLFVITGKTKKYA